MFFNGNKSNLNFLLLITITYLISRLIFFFFGISYDASSLDFYWQFIDKTLLENDLINGVFYQHTQPPIFNLFLGLVLKLHPENYEYIFSTLYHIFGLIIYFIIYDILRLSKFNSWTAFGIATIFSISPEAVLYENWLFYTWPIATLLLLAVYALFLYEKTLKFKYAVQFLTIISLICLTRSMFHLIYLSACIILVLSIRSPNRKKIGIISIASLLLVGSIFIKNFVLFGFFGSSSWMGMNLWDLAKNGEISTLVADPNITSVNPFSSISQYPEKYQIVPIDYSDIPVLTAEYKRNGEINLNHYGYLSVSHEYLKASTYSITNNPLNYLHNIIKGWGIYSKPAWDYRYLTENKNQIQGYIDVTSFAKPRLYIERELLGIHYDYNFPISSLLVMPSALLFITIYLTINIIKFIRGYSSHINHQVFFSFMVLTILYVAVIGNNIGMASENNRFRVQTDPLLYLAIVISIREIWINLQKKSQKGRKS